MQCLIEWLPKIDDGEHFTVTIGDETAKGYVSGLSKKVGRISSAYEVWSTIRRNFPTVNFKELEFVEVKHGTV